MRKLAATLFVLSAPALAYADDAVKRDASLSADTATFLPFTDSPGSQSHMVKTLGVYDGARGGAALDTTVEAKLSEKFQLEAQLEVEAGEASPSIEGQFDLLEEKQHGIDLQAAVGVDASGFNEVPAVFAKATVGGHVSGTYLVGDSQFELGTQRGERAAVLGFAGIRDLGGHLYMGFDSRLRVDLEKDMSEPEGEASWDLVAGPLATYATGRYAITAALGLSGTEPRDAMTSDVGAFASLGVGAVF
ncbi:MAG TPA: hypothetical protein VMZ53_14845 [Kofleriaceae bacterium]|nr:hypothetical protein [Kofleriaceae bacterium]